MDDIIEITDPAVIADPFAAYGRLLDHPGLGRAVLWPGAEPIWVAVRYADCQQVLSDQRFVLDAANVPDSDVPSNLDRLGAAVDIPEHCLKYLRAGLANNDGADHLRLRKPATRAFAVRRIAALRPRIEQLTAELVDALPEHTDADGVVDLLQHFGYPLPIAVICELIGVPEEDRSWWRETSARLGQGPGPGYGDVVDVLIKRAAELIERRRGAPGDDLLSALIDAEAGHDGGHGGGGNNGTLGDDEVVSLVVSLITAGHETTANLITNGMAALLAHPDQLATARSEPEAMSRVVHELMRWCGPALGTFPRHATEDLEVGGTLVRRGEAVMPVPGVGNRDPREYADPDRLDVTREPGGGEHHLGFGAGRHYCLGAALAKLEAEVAFGGLLARWPDLRLAVDPSELVRGANPGTWHLAGLPVRL